jgi:phosphonate transport system substrate-binding protein
MRAVSSRPPGPSAGDIRVGVTLAGGFTRAHLDELCAALGAETRLDVRPVGVWYYHRLVEALDLGHVDIAWLPPILAAQALARGSVTPIALPIRGGVTSYSTALFARPDGPIRDIGDLDHVRAAWVDRQSASGYLLIRAHLRVLGLDLERAFANDLFAGSHEEVTAAVLGGTADVGASFMHLDPSDDRPVRAAWGTARVRVIAHAGPIPADVIAANTRLDPARADRVRNALVAPRTARLRDAAHALLGAEGFAEPRKGHLDAVAALLPRLDEHALTRPVGLPRH